MHRDLDCSWQLIYQRAGALGRLWRAVLREIEKPTASSRGQPPGGGSTIHGPCLRSSSSRSRAACSSLRPPALRHHSSTNPTWPDQARHLGPGSRLRPTNPSESRMPSSRLVEATGIAGRHPGPTGIPSAIHPPPTKTRPTEIDREVAGDRVARFQDSLECTRITATGMATVRPKLGGTN